MYPVLFTSIPKCGTHLLLNYLTATRFEHAGPFGKIGWEDGFIEYVRKLKPGQYSAWHFRWTEKLSAIVRDNSVRVIFLYRDPRAHLVSKLNWVMEQPAHAWHPYFVEILKDRRERMYRLIEGIPPEDVKRYLPGFDFLDPVSPLAPRSPLPAGINWVFGTFAGWLTDPQSLPVKYEDIVGPQGGGSREQQIATVRKIMEFTGVNSQQADPQAIADVLYDTASPTFRKGRIDSWRDEFDDEFQQAFLRLSKGLLDLYGYAP